MEKQTCLKVGDVVLLRSGGVSMVVTAIGESKAAVEYMTPDFSIEKNTVSLVAIELASENARYLLQEENRNLELQVRIQQGKQVLADTTAEANGLVRAMQGQRPPQLR